MNNEMNKKGLIAGIMDRPLLAGTLGIAAAAVAEIGGADVSS